MISEFVESFGEVVSGVADAVGDVVSGIADAIGDVVSGVADAIGGLFGGGDEGGGGEGGGGEGGGDGSDGGDGFKPIVLDLDDDGLEPVALEESTAFYDINGDGYRERVAWASADDGFLAYDKDGDGKITAHDELSFVSYVEGARTDLEAWRTSIPTATARSTQATRSGASSGSGRTWTRTARAIRASCVR